MTANTFANPEYEVVNTAHIIDRGGVLVVDPGITEPGVRTEYVEALAERGHDLAEAESVLVTHFHFDHVGLAAEIQEAGGAMVYVHLDDAPIVRGDRRARGDADSAAGAFRSLGRAEKEAGGPRGTTITATTIPSRPSPSR